MKLLKSFLSLFHGKQKRLTANELLEFMKSAGISPENDMYVVTDLIDKHYGTLKAEIRIGGVEILTDDEASVLVLKEF